LGLAAVTSSFLSFAYEFGLRNAFKMDAEHALSSIYKDLHKQLDQFDEVGLVGIHNSVTPKLLKQKFEEAAKANESANVPRTIRILQTYTGMPENDQGLKSLLKRATKAGKSDIRILLLDPLSVQVEYRAAALNLEKKEMRQRIKTDLLELEKLCPENVKVYDATPMFHIYRFGETSLMGAYWRGELSIRGSQLEVHHTKAKDEDSERLADLIDEYFDSLWDNLPSDKVKDLPTALADLVKQENKEREEADSEGMKADVPLIMHSRLQFKYLERKFRSLIDKARNSQQKPKIRILQTALAHRDEGIISLIDSAAKAGCKVRILLLDPSSGHVAGRAEALEALDAPRFTPERIRTDIIGDLTLLRDLNGEMWSDSEKENTDANLEVKVYDAAPTIQLYDFDGIRIIGVPWRQCASRNAPQLEVKYPSTSSHLSSLAKRMDVHFEDLWEKTTTIDARDALERVNKSTIRNLLSRNGVLRRTNRQRDGGGDPLEAGESPR
jgi:hypothetical protein